MTVLLEKPVEVAKNLFLLRIKPTANVNKPLAGQFVNIKVTEEHFPLIRRPISIFNYNDEIIELVVQEIGTGTRLICQKEPGTFDMLGPFGHGFTITENKRVLIAGGGVGNAPLYYLACRLKELNNHVTYIYGARSKDYIFLEDRYKAVVDDFYIMTDDGSKGKKGFTTDMASELFASKNYDVVYTCGPDLMMKGITSITPSEVKIEVSMEKYFACGAGLCAGCTVETTGGLKRACYEGPVMDGTTIVW